MSGVIQTNQTHLYIPELCKSSFRCELINVNHLKIAFKFFFFSLPLEIRQSSGNSFTVVAVSESHFFLEDEDSLSYFCVEQQSQQVIKSEEL